MATKKKLRREAFPDHLRKTERITLRVAPNVAQRLRALAKREEMTLAETIARALEALEGKASR